MIYLGDGSSSTGGRSNELQLYMENGAQTSWYGMILWANVHPTGLYVYTRTAPASDSLPSASTKITKVLDTNNQIVDISSVNYANVFLYGTDGNPLHDAMDTATIDALYTESVDPHI